MEQEMEDLDTIVLEAAGATELGQRHCNEDVVLVRDDLQLYLVADGAGGHEAGDVASALAARSISNYIGATVRSTYDKGEFDQFGLPTGARRLSAAIQKANRDIREVAHSSQRHRGMGTTVVAASFSPRSGLMHVAHVGDSRCYRFRGDHLEQLTEDHNLLNDVLEERPELEDSVLANLPKHVVTRALGMQAPVRVAVRSHAVAAGDRFLLCSDGLSVPVPARVIAETLALDKPPGAIVQHLLNLALDAGARDNVAVLVIDSSGGPRSTLPPDLVRRAHAATEPARREQSSGPELLLLGIEEIDLEGAASFQVVPNGSATASEQAALAAFGKDKPPR